MTGNVSDIPAIMGRFVAEDFIGENIAASNIIDVMRNTDSGTGYPITMGADTGTDKVIKNALHILRSYNPRIVLQGSRFADSLRREGEQDFLYSPLGVIFATFAPFRPIPLAFDDGEKRAFRNLHKDTAEISSITYPVLSPAPNADTPGRTRELLDKRFEVKQRQAAKMLALHEGWTKIRGGDSAAVARSMVGAGNSKRAVDALLRRGAFERPVFSKESETRLRRDHPNRWDEYRDYLRDNPRFNPAER